MNCKRLFLIMIIFICCGCSAKYSIDFNGNNIVQKLYVEYNGISLSNDELKSYYSDLIPVNDNSKFLNFNVDHNNSSSIGLNFDYSYNKNNYSSAYLPNDCFSIFDFFEEDDKYYFSANGPFLCSSYEYSDLDSLDVVFTTNHNVISNNAHEIDGNKYIWHINSDNYDDISIIFITDSKINLKSTIIGYAKLLIPIGCAVSIILVIVLAVFIRYKKVNKI